MNTLSITHTGVARALAWLECELMLCSIEELQTEFEHMFHCKFSEDRQNIIFKDDTDCYWFGTKWR